MIAVSYSYKCYLSRLRQPYGNFKSFRRISVHNLAIQSKIVKLDRDKIC